MRLSVSAMPLGVRVPFAALLVALLAIAPASAPAESPLPGTRTAEDRAEWRDLLRWPAVCEREWRSSGLDLAGITTWRNGSGRLVAVSCLRGAYQGTAMLYVLDSRRRARGPLSFRIHDDRGDGRPRLRTTKRPLGDLSFSARTRVLTVLARGRGLGDCGIRSTFRLRGARAVPLEARAKTRCDGRFVDPRRWPRLPG